MKKKALFSIIVLFSLVGCGPISTRGMVELSIQSVPSGADVLVDGQRIGVTPMTASLSTVENHHVLLEKEGFRGETILLRSRVHGLLAFFIDGYFYQLSPDEISITLERDRNPRH